MEVGQQSRRVHGLEPGWETPDDLPDAFHHEDTVLVTEAAVAHTLVQELDKGGADIVVITPVDNLDSEHIEGSDHLGTVGTPIERQRGAISCLLRRSVTEVRAMHSFSLDG